MRLKHKTLTLVLPVLLLALVFAGCDDSSTNNPQNPGAGNPADSDVSSLDVLIGTTSFSGPFGKTDTVTVEVTALNSSNEAVEGATVAFNPAPSVGRIVFTDGNKTGADGKVGAQYIVTYLTPGTVNATLTATVGNTDEEVAISVETEEVRIVASADPTNAVVVAGEAATSTITVRVLDSDNQAVAGVPVNIEISNTADAVLSEPTFNETNNTYSSTLEATIPDTADGLSVDLRAFIDLPAGAQVQSVGKRVSLPVIQPGKEAPTVDSDGGSADDAPMIDSERPLSGKRASELPTWEVGEGVGDKGDGSRIADVVSEVNLNVTWTTWGSSPSSIYVAVNPSMLLVEPTVSDTAQVTIVAADDNNNGIQGVQLYLSLVNTQPTGAVGTISIPAVTDSNGRTTAMISTNGNYGVWEIQARTSPGQADPATATLTVEEGSMVSDAYLAIEPATLFVEPGNTGQATVTAIAYDNNNNAVPAYDLFMRLADASGNPVGGTIAPPDSTDSSGLTTTTINTNGAYGDWTVEVYPYQNATTPLATADVSVQVGSSIKSIAMSLSKQTVKAEPNANKQINVTATAKDDDNIGLANRRVFFSLRNPSDPGAVGSITAADTTDSSGVTEAIINTNGEYGDWVVEARAYPTQPDPMATRTLSVVEGSDVTEISVTISPDILTPAPETSDSAQVFLVARNNQGAGVRDAELYVSLRNIIPGELTGSISQPDSTSGTGSAVSLLTTNGRYGTWIVEAKPYETSNLVFRDTVQVLEGQASYVTVAADSNRIAVRGTNGLEQTTIRATIYDENDVPVQDGSKVYFLAQQFPWEDGDEFRLMLNGNNGQFTPDDTLGQNMIDPRTDLFNLPFAQATVNNGEASITMTSGVRKGLVRLRVWTVDDDTGEDIATIFNGVQVVAGPPAAIEVSAGAEGFDGGGTLWEVEVSARVTDELNNEVGDGYQVFYSVAPDIATITATGFTGNESKHTNLITPGIAYTVIQYNSFRTNDEVTITAWVMDNDGNMVQDETDFVLPIQEPVGTLTIVPTVYYYGLNGNEPGVFRCRLDVMDGHNWPINNQDVQFNPARGAMYRSQFDDPLVDDPWYFGRTGPMDHPSGEDPVPQDPTGQSIRWLILTIDTGFPLPDEPSATVQVGANILGTTDATVEPVTIYLYR